MVGCAGSVETVKRPAQYVDVATIDGEITWQVLFDSDAEEAGLADCTYRRTYTGTEDRSSPWLCPECEVTFVADVEIVEGRSCYDLISNYDPEPREWLGYSGGDWFRGGAVNYRLSFQGAVDIEGAAVTTTYASEHYEHPDGGTFQLVVNGDLTLGEDHADPWHGLVPPPAYACGWPTANPPEFKGEYAFEVGRKLPDGVFLDRCEEPVRLHDFNGRYLVIDISALDCPPCQDKARGEHDFVANMAAADINVEVITLLAPSLSAPLDPAEPSVLNSWMLEFGLLSPVLADRGYGYWMGGEALGNDFGYPTSLTVGPDLKIIDIRSGFGGWATWERIISADEGSGRR